MTPELRERLARNLTTYEDPQLDHEAPVYHKMKPMKAWEARAALLDVVFSDLAAAGYDVVEVRES